MYARRTRRAWRATGLAAVALFAVTACGGGGGSDASAGGGVGDCSDYPSHDVTMVIGRSPGGGHDEYGRFLAPLLEKELGTTVVIDNVDGAGGRVAANQVQNAEPDGYTIHLMEPNGLAALQSVQDVDYDVAKFTPLGIVNSRPSAVALAADSAIQSFENLVAEGKNHELRFATAGLTSPNFINGLIIADATGMKVTQVPHAGSAEAITSVVRGDTDFTVFSGDSIVESVDAGDLKALAQFGDEPLDILSDVPLASDVGLDELEGVLTTNLVLVAPPGLPDCLQTTLTDAVQKVLNSDEFAQFGEQGRIVTPGTPEELQQLMEDSLKTYSQYGRVFQEYLGG